MTNALFAQIDTLNPNQLVNMTEVKSGSGGRGLLPTGTAIVRLSSYIEFGKHIVTFGGQAKPAAPQFKLGFCIVGGGGQNKAGEGEPYVQEDGNFPCISTFDTAMSQHEKAKARLFNKTRKDMETLERKHSVAPRDDIQGRITQMKRALKIIEALDKNEAVPATWTKLTLGGD